ncbi:MAG: ferredoxin [Methanosphaera sp. rholeuAM74]|nr:MAG: ferredoxin [Methanosphaera sp. rholeuAM74]
MSLGKIFFNGLYTNLKRLIFASDCVTDAQIREDALNGNIKPTPKVAEIECIGCGGCSNVCPTKAITMIPVEPVEIAEGIVKTAVPEIDEISCVHCYHCHDFCPIYALFGVAATIHPNYVGTKCSKDVTSMVLDPNEVSEAKIKYIAQFLTDDSIIEKRRALEEQAQAEAEEQAQESVDDSSENTETEG